MGCRVGMTQNEQERKSHWESRYPSLSGWQILGRFATKTEAQQAETRFAAQYGCDSSPGGDGPEHGNWVVYKFQY